MAGVAVGVAAGTGAHGADGAICLAAKPFGGSPAPIDRALLVIYYSQKPPGTWREMAPSPGPTRRVSCRRIPLTPAMAPDPLQAAAAVAATAVTSETRPVVGSDEQAFDYLR